MKTSIVLAITLLFATTAFALNESVIKVMAPDRSYEGTGFAVSTPRGDAILTNRHLCGKEKFLLGFDEMSNVSILIVRKVYATHDLCLLSPAKKIKPLLLAAYYTFGEPVSVEGYPDGNRATSKGNIGKYSFLTPEKEPMFFIIYHGTVTFGSSGSPVFNENGEVIGIISVVDVTKSEFGGAVPLEFIKEFINN